jgi:hypothetical protein
MSSLAAVVDTLQEQNRSMETVKDGILTLVKESKNARVAYERGAGDRAEAAREKRREKSARVSTPSTFTGGVKQGLGLTALADMAGNLFGGMLGGGLAASIGVLAGRILKKGAIAGLAAVFLGDAIEKALSSFGFELTDEQQSDVNKKATSALYAYMIASFATKNPYVKVLAAIGGAFGSEITGWLSRTFGWNKNDGTVTLPGDLGELDTLNPNVQTAIGAITTTISGLALIGLNKVRKLISGSVKGVDAAAIPKKEPSFGPSPQQGVEDYTKRPTLGGVQRASTPVSSLPKAKYMSKVVSPIAANRLAQEASESIREANNIIRSFNERRAAMLALKVDPRLSDSRIAPKPLPKILSGMNAYDDIVGSMGAAANTDELPKAMSNMQKAMTYIDPIMRLANKVALPLTAAAVTFEGLSDKQMVDATSQVESTAAAVRRLPLATVDAIGDVAAFFSNAVNSGINKVIGTDLKTDYAGLDLAAAQRDRQLAIAKREAAAFTSFIEGFESPSEGRNVARIAAGGPSTAMEIVSAYEAGQQRRGSSAPVIINEGDNITNNNVSGGGSPRPAPRSAVDSVATTKELVSGGRRGYRPGG